MPNPFSMTPRPEYPRPQFVRSEWLNLNGLWEFAFDDADAGVAAGWAGRAKPLGGDILVPFPFQSRLSGIRERGSHEVLWYAREFAVPAGWEERDVFLRFGAVDAVSTAWLNGCQLGMNRGGRVPFSFNLTPFLRAGSNRLVVRVTSGPGASGGPGSQRRDEAPPARSGGIWQTVWLEPLPPRRIESVRITPNIDAGSVRLKATLTRPGTGLRFSARVARLGYRVAGGSIANPGGDVDLELDLGKVDHWSPERPNLYDLELELSAGDGSPAVDQVMSYFGMRKLAIEEGEVLLNNRPYYQKLVFDQGFYPDGLLSAPGDDALRADVDWARRFGFNGVRKYEKVEDPRFLYWCDRLGLLVWGGMGCARDYAPERETDLLVEWERIIRRDYNHPCVVAWAPLAGHGEEPGAAGAPEMAAFMRRVTALTRSLDGTRLVLDHEGLRQGDRPDEPAPAVPFPGAHELAVHGGGWEVAPGEPSTAEAGTKPAGGGTASERERALLNRYRSALRGLVEKGSSAGFCYPQLTDVGADDSGLLTGSRQPKISPRAVAAVNRRTPLGVPATPDAPLPARPPVTRPRESN